MNELNEQVSLWTLKIILLYPPESEPAVLFNSNGECCDVYIPSFLPSFFLAFMSRYKHVWIWDCSVVEFAGGM